MNSKSIFFAALTSLMMGGSLIACGGAPDPVSETSTPNETATEPALTQELSNSVSAADHRRHRHPGYATASSQAFAAAQSGGNGWAVAQTFSSAIAQSGLGGSPCAATAISVAFAAAASGQGGFAVAVAASSATASCS